MLAIILHTFAPDDEPYESKRVAFYITTDINVIISTVM
jgi:hypothetical protein